MVVCNVHMIAAAARQNLNAGFPLAVAAACYTALAFFLNLVVFREARDGLLPYARAHWPRLVAVAMAVPAGMIAPAEMVRRLT